MLHSHTTKYIDLDTGQLLTAKEAKKHYLIIKTKTHAKIKWNEGRCDYEHTKLCRRNPQGRLFN